MSTSYIPEETYAVCTYQMGASPQKFIASRDKVSVFHKDKPLLTVADKNLEKQFTCKSPVNVAASFLALGAGLVVGALLLSNPVGWLVAGCLVVAVGVAYTVKAVNHQCTSPMKAGSWMLYHPSVKFNGHYAITQVSMLSCSSGGVLKPFFSYTLACAAAKRVSNNNLAEVGVNVVISFFSGLLAPAGISTVLSKYGIIKGIGFIATTNIAGLGVTWTIQYGQREYMRSDNNFDNNSIYQNMNETVDENTFLQTIDDPSDPNDIYTLTEFSDAIKNGEVAIDNQQLKNDLAKLDGLSDYKLRKSELAKQIFKDLNDGKYGAATKAQIKSKYARWIGNNKKNVALGRQVAANNFKTALKNMGKNTGQGALFFLPFLGTYFSENARKVFAEEAVKDMTNGINVVTQTPLG